MFAIPDSTKSVKLGGMDLFTHMIVVGPTRCGKTATILKPMIMQILEAKKRGVECGLSVIEPKGDVAQMVADVSEEMGLPYTHIDPEAEETAQFNPMEGEINDVAEATVVVLKGLFGKQDAFFATVQELSARNVTKLLKELHGDNLDITDVLNSLQDVDLLQRQVKELRKLKGESNLTQFFENELLGSMGDKYRQFVIGLRAQLENIISNDSLKRIMTGRSSINIDEHFATGGILAVNTALGKLRTSGDAFGQFVIMHLQNGTFRRPGTEDTRIPHILIVDEYSRYINPDVEVFLSIAASYKVAGIFATQSLGQLSVESGKYSAQEIKRSILTNCRSKICFGGVASEDAKEFADIFGKDKITMRQSTYKNRILLPNLFPDNYRDTEAEEYRFDPTDLIDGLPRFHFVHQLMDGGQLQKPDIAKGEFIPRDWKERKAWEVDDTPPKIAKVQRFKTSFVRLMNELKNKRKKPAEETLLLPPPQEVPAAVIPTTVVPVSIELVDNRKEVNNREEIKEDTNSNADNAKESCLNDEKSRKNVVISGKIDNNGHNSKEKNANLSKQEQKDLEQMKQQQRKIQDDFWD
ncbi:type IV secretory system conjugative DNA transfer family protein [Viridibacillus arvi]|uniref:type IV secretory system conjugative DNA transfer family protein n=1 Tax=Viridibacillus arvi TaxID=263475 RepID=UPI003CFBD433